MSTEARKLSLYATNSGLLYRRYVKPILQNLAKHKKRGNYDHEKAMIVWRKFAALAAKAYVEEFCNAGEVWSSIFRTPCRDKAAIEIAAHYEDELQTIVEGM